MEIDGPAVFQFQIVRENVRQYGKQNKVCGNDPEQTLFRCDVDFQGKIQHENFHNQTPLEIGFPAGYQSQDRGQCHNDGTEEGHGIIGAVAVSIDKGHKEKSGGHEFQKGNDIVGGCKQSNRS